MKRVEGAVDDILVARSDESAVCRLSVMSYNCCGAYLDCIQIALCHCGV